MALTVCDSCKTQIICANCGGFGHVYKNCNHPVTSYGIICIRIIRDEITGMYIPQYLMVQRKDSLSYVEFLRGKYSLDKRSYILKLVSQMTVKERYMLKTLPFDVLWKCLWQANDYKAYQKEYSQAKEKYEHIRNGYFMKNEENELFFFNMDYIMKNTTSNIHEAEWGFPKGRRNINENDFSCAMREFKEETGIHPRNIRVLYNQKPFEEIFNGTNKIRYKHIYYLALCFNYENNIYNPKNKVQSREIKDAQWFTYDEAQKKIHPRNVERKELFRRVHQVITKNIYIDSINVFKENRQD